MESRRTQTADHGKAPEMDRYLWFPGPRAMGGGIEDNHGNGPFQASDYPGMPVKDGKIAQIADSVAG